MSTYNCYIDSQLVFGVANVHVDAVVLKKYTYRRDCLNRTCREYEKFPVYGGFRLIGRNFSRRGGDGRPKIIQLITDSGLKVSGLDSRLYIHSTSKRYILA